MDFKNQIGSKVIFLGKLKMLDEGSIGILNNVYGDYCTIIYPQNQAYEDDGKGGYKLIKNAPNKIYAHSAKLNEIKMVS